MKNVCMRTHRAKHCSLTILTDAGRQTDESDEHPRNARGSSFGSTDPLSNASVERLRHRAKQSSPRVETDAGKQMDESDEHFINANVAIWASFDPFSKVTTENSVQ
jgi:hypothetical protein